MTGFVTCTTREEGERACQEMNGTDLDGRTIRCDFADKISRPSAGTVCVGVRLMRVR